MGRAGFSVIEILVTVAILAIIGLASAQMTVNLHRNIVYSEAKAEAEVVRDEIQTFLRNPDVCLLNFAGTTLPLHASSDTVRPMNAGDGAIIQIRDRADEGAVVFSTSGGLVNFPKLRLQDVYLDGVLDITTSPPLMASARLVLKPAIDNGEDGLRPLKDKHIRINFGLNAARQVVSCSALGSAAGSNDNLDNLCAALGGTVVAGRCTLPITPGSPGTTVVPDCASGGSGGVFGGIARSTACDNLAADTNYGCPSSSTAVRVPVTLTTRPDGDGRTNNYEVMRTLNCIY